jgi:NDP-sugar pyrophosphorylase family protein
MKAMILAAGLGTRLRPLTHRRPKALVPVANQPIIGRVIDYLKANGITQLVVNAHHRSEQMVTYLNGGKPFGLEIKIRVEPEILGTGGGIRNTMDFWDKDPFIVINGDTITDIDLKQAYEDHQRFGALSSLILHNYPPHNQVMTDEEDNITDISHECADGRLAFTGIHIINPEMLSLIPEGQYSDIIDCYRELILAGDFPHAYLAEGHYWRDIGTIESYLNANRELAGEDPFRVGYGTRLDPSVKLREWGIIGDRSQLERGVEIRRSVLWEDSYAREGVRIVDSVVTGAVEVDKDLFKAIF